MLEEEEHADFGYTYKCRDAIQVSSETKQKGSKRIKYSGTVCVIFSTKVCLEKPYLLAGSIEIESKVTHKS